MGRRSGIDSRTTATLPDSSFKFALRTSSCGGQNPVSVEGKSSETGVIGKIDEKSHSLNRIQKQILTDQAKALKSSVYFRIRHAGHWGRYEPRFKPPRERLLSGEPIIHNHLPLGGYDSFEEAKNVHDIAAFYYGKAEPHLDLGDGRHFAIDSSWNEQLDFRRGKEKAKWVASKAKEVFQDFKKAKASLGLLNASNNLTSVIPSGEQIAYARDSSHSGFSSPAINKSTENHASSSRTTLPVESNPDEQRFVQAVFDGNAEYFPISSPSPVTQDFIEPAFSPLGLLEYPEMLGAYLEDFSDEQLVEKNSPWLDDFLRSLPDSIFNANGHPQCSAVNVTANELRASLFEPDGPCFPVEENGGSYVEAAIPARMSLDITTVPIDGTLPTSQGLQDGMDVGAPLSDPSFCSELSKEDHLFKLLNFYQQECKNYKRRISELEREVKRLKGKSPMSFDA